MKEASWCLRLDAHHSRASDHLSISHHAPIASIKPRDTIGRWALSRCICPPTDWGCYGRYNRVSRIVGRCICSPTDWGCYYGRYNRVSRIVGRVVERSDARRYPRSDALIQRLAPLIPPIHHASVVISLRAHELSIGQKHTCERYDNLPHLLLVYDSV